MSLECKRITASWDRNLCLLLCDQGLIYSEWKWALSGGLKTSGLLGKESIAY